MAYEIVIDTDARVGKTIFADFIEREQVQSWQKELLPLMKEKKIRAPFMLLLDFLHVHYMASSAIEEFQRVFTAWAAKRQYSAMALIYFTPLGAEQIGGTLDPLRGAPGKIGHFTSVPEAMLWLATIS